LKSVIPGPRDEKHERLDLTAENAKNAKNAKGVRVEADWSGDTAYNDSSAIAGRGLTKNLAGRSPD
jgi:hypothetical protein